MEYKFKSEEAGKLQLINESDVVLGMHAEISAWDSAVRKDGKKNSVGDVIARLNKAANGTKETKAFLMECYKDAFVGSLVDFAIEIADLAISGNGEREYSSDDKAAKLAAIEEAKSKADAEKAEAKAKKEAEKAAKVAEKAKKAAEKVAKTEAKAAEKVVEEERVLDGTADVLDVIPDAPAEIINEDAPIFPAKLLDECAGDFEAYEAERGSLMTDEEQKHVSGKIAFDPDMFIDAHNKVWSKKDLQDANKSAAIAIDEAAKLSIIASLAE